MQNPMDRYVKCRKEAADCVTSLHHAMQDAGGRLFSVNEMESMTIMDFICQVAAQNGIRFVFKGPIDKPTSSNPKTP